MIVYEACDMKEFKRVRGLHFYSMEARIEILKLSINFYRSYVGYKNYDYYFKT